MKKIQILFLVLLAFVACSKKDEVSPKDSFINSLTSSTWVTESVYNETDGDLTSLYSNFSIAFRKNQSGGYAGDYYVANGGHAFTSSFGKWNISDDLKTMTFDNGKQITTDLSNNKLKLDFMVSPKGGRINGLSGHFIFQLKKAQ
jgi:hypothetical protein